MSIGGDRVSIDDNINHRSLKRIRVDASPSYWLSFDVVCSILVKLPVKSILQFRSVSKSWNQLISEPNFVKLQLIEARTKPSRILLMTKNDLQPDSKKKTCLYSLEEQDFIPDLLSEWEELSQFSPIVSKYDCDGLLLIYSQKYIGLWNPSTRDNVRLSDFSHNVPLFEDTAQHIGFGYDPTTNLYKVVRLFYRFFSLSENDEVFDENVGCEVYVQGTNSWRQIKDPPYGPDDDFSASAKGVIYWMALTNYTTDLALLSFDITNEKFGVIRPPATIKFSEETKCIRYLLLNGHGDTLWLVNVDWDSNTFDTWELTDATKHSWKRIHRISNCEPRISKYHVLPKLVIRNGKCILLRSNQQLQCYDIRSKQFKEILAISSISEEEDCDLFLSVYMETLVSLKLM